MFPEPARMTLTIRRMAAIGLAQGLLLWALGQLTSAGRWPAGHPAALLALVYATVAVPLAWYLSQDIAGLTRRRRTTIVIATGLGTTLLGACEGWVTAKANGLPDPGLSVPACMVLAFVALPLMAHVHRAPGRGHVLGVHWHYAALFDTAWRNALVLCVAALLTAVFWGVLFAGATLMRSIGVDQVLDVITHPLFVSLSTPAVFASAVALALARADTILVLRRFCMSLYQAFLPLVLLFAVMWTAALPFTGIQPLLDTGKAGLALLWFAALAVNFANAGRQDGLTPPPFTPMFRRVLAYAWLTLPVVVGVAAIAVYQRIAQYGWTAERVWSVFVLVMAAGYTIGYALSVWRPARGWMWSIDPTNVLMALVLCAGLVALTSPLADARRISVNSQIDRLLAGTTPLRKLDFHYLHYDSGFYGTRALQALAAGVPGHPDADRFARAAQAELDGKLWERGGLGETDATEDEDDLRPNLDEVRKRLRLLDGDAPPSPALVDALLAYLSAHTMSRDTAACLDVDVTCSLWMADLNDDAQPELVLIADQRWRADAFVYRWQPESAVLTPVGKIDDVKKAWIDDIRAGKAKRPTTAWRDIEAGGMRLRIVPDRQAPAD
jgi:hypothetical protein